MMQHHDLKPQLSENKSTKMKPAVDDESKTKTQHTPLLTNIAQLNEDVANNCGTQTADLDTDNFLMFSAANSANQSQRSSRPQTVGQRYNHTKSYG